MTEPDERSYSTPEVAAMLGCARSTVLHYARLLFGGRFRPGAYHRFTVDDVEQLRRFAEQRRAPRTAEDLDPG